MSAPTVKSLAKPFDRRWLIAVVAALLAIGFVTTAMLSFSVSRDALRESITQSELPLTSDTIYSEIRRDLITPILVSSLMANDTFVRDWILGGEKDVNQIAKYLTSIKERYGTTSASLTTEATHTYYYPGGVLKNVDMRNWRDAWYFRVRQMKEDYEINVDFDLANSDAWTIFINYRVYDYDHKFIGATGVGLTFNQVNAMIDKYESRYHRLIYFVDHNGRVVLSGHNAPPTGQDIHAVPGLDKIADGVLKPEGDNSFEYKLNGQTHLLNVRFISELNWYVFVERVEDEALAGVRHALYYNLAIALIVTLIVVALVGATIIWYQRGLERAAATDKLTGLVNRQAFDLLLDQGIKHAQRGRTPLSLLMIDIDHFKSINDKYGHLAGDKVIQDVAQVTMAALRKSDVVCRWGGEEFLVMLGDCDRNAAYALAEKVRHQVEQLTSADLAAIKTTVSLGTTQMESIDTENTLLQRVDEALYEAKRAGRNRTILA
ncbi:MAG TPA: sensor domain-containing diguanylate cyclase [Magnetospirillaceae bacterium]|jgi:diguanylate cyclase (GGDEF)-like protein